MAWGGPVNWKFSAGSTWVIDFTVTSARIPVPIFTPVAKLRRQIDDTVAAASFSCSVISSADGHGQAVLSAATSGSLVLDPSTDDERDSTPFFYDVDVTLADGSIIRILQGIVLVSPHASR